MASQVDSQQDSLTHLPQTSMVPSMSGGSAMEQANVIEADFANGGVDMEGDGVDGGPGSPSTRKVKRREQNRAAQRVWRAKAKIQNQEVSISVWAGV
jgi:hypothetical protein